MIINDTTVELTQGERKVLRDFFRNNKHLLDNVDLSEAVNIACFVELYEAYLIENNLMDDDILKLFLCELKCSLLSAKITKKTRSGIIFKKENRENAIDNEVINKWYEESNIDRYISEDNLESLDSINNVRERKRRFQVGGNVAYK